MSILFFPPTSPANILATREWSPPLVARPLPASTSQLEPKAPQPHPVSSLSPYLPQLLRLLPGAGSLMIPHEGQYSGRQRQAAPLQMKKPAIPQERLRFPVIQLQQTHKPLASLFASLGYRQIGYPSTEREASEIPGTRTGKSKLHETVQS